MGKKRITQLLDQLKDNQQQELHNAAAIYTVAQVAINELDKENTLEISSTNTNLPAAPENIEKSELLQRYGSYNACRKAAKAQGIKFSHTPSWSQLTSAFSYAQALQRVVAAYNDLYPNQELKGTVFEVTL